MQYGFGIPKRAFRRVPHPYSIILPTVTELPPELEDREMDVEHVSIPLYSGDYAWKLQYKVLPKNKARLGVILENTENTVRVKSVLKNSNAERAGLIDGDMLLVINETKLVDIDDLTGALRSLSIGDKAKLFVKKIRNDEEFYLHCSKTAQENYNNLLPLKKHFFIIIILFNN